MGNPTKPLAANCLTVLRPDIAKQWHPTLNTITPKEVTVCSAKKAWFQCDKDKSHVWEARIFSRTKNASGCPFCTKTHKTAHPTNCLATTHPNLIKEWHVELNGELSPNDVVSGSAKIVWWQCSVVPTHIWKSSIVHRAKDETGCPYCTNQKVCIDNCLAMLSPEVAVQWHPTKNGLLTPFDVVPGSPEYAWFKCYKAEDHEWQAIINNRTMHNASCPCCCGRKLVKSNCLATTHPQIAKEWHPTKNGDITPNDVTYALNTSYWWQCPANSDHEWSSRIDARTRASGTGCPYCASSKGEKAIREYLEENHITFTSQHRIPECKNKRPLPFDFAIFTNDKLVGLIEFNGRQHYEYVPYFGGDAGHKLTLKNDQIKLDYCIKNNIAFLQVPFWNVDVLTNELKKFVEKIL